MLSNLKMTDTLNSEEWVYLIKMDEYTEVLVSINPKCQEILANIFFTNFTCNGVILEENEYKNLKLLKSVNDKLKAYIVDFDEDKVKELLKTEKKSLLDNGLTEEDLGSWDIEFTKIENQDWSKKWKEHWKPEKIGENIVVSPSWEDYKKKDNEILITLDPGSAFGTGTHATTQLCILALGKYLKKDDVVADIGTGSGILSIIAVKMGAKNVFACDNDELVIDVAKENAKINGVQDKIEIQHLTADKITEKFNFVTANILHNVLAEIMGDLKNLLTDDGILALSGILDEKKQVVLDSIKKQDLKIKDIITQGDWVSYVVEK